jgi:DNA-binding SARP family transcriptional activator
MMPLLTIKLLGGFDLVYCNQSLASALSERLRALIAYLVLHRHTSQSREHLAFLLWPGSSASQARTNLRRAIHSLRQLIPDIEQFIVMEAQTLQWRADAPFVADVTEFEDAIASAEAAEKSTHPTAAFAALEKAVSLYQGKLLPQCSDKWIKPEQKRLQEVIVQMYEQLVQKSSEQQNYSAVIRYSQHLLRLEPFNESAYVHLISSYAHSGDRVNAMESYQRCQTILGEGLGIKPKPETQLLYESLLR